MDNKKIGKLIADLRRKQGLTQEQLGEKVGVGFRAVSKWECGKTLPDIGIINELTKILGISSDELLSGELKSKDKSESKKKISSKIIITISILTVILIFITTIYIYQKNKIYTYKTLSTEENKYYINGTANYNNGNISMTISDIYFKDDELNNIIIENYEYVITVKDTFVFGYGYIETMEALEKPISIKEFMNKLNINVNTKTNLGKDEFSENNILLRIKMLTNEKEEITKELNIRLIIDEKIEK